MKILEKEILMAHSVTNGMNTKGSLNSQRSQMHSFKFTIRNKSQMQNLMAVLCRMPTIQYSAGSARLYLIGDSLGPPKSSMQMRTWVASEVFAGLTR